MRMHRTAMPWTLALLAVACEVPHAALGQEAILPPTFSAVPPRLAATRIAAGEVATRPGGLPSATGALTVLRLGDAAPADPMVLPLEKTVVEIDITGSVARTRVTQYFSNANDAPIEAVYTFPLPKDAAVDAMTMKIGERTIRAEIKKRDEARELYEAAKANGQRAALLEQERPNIFTQSVTNIMPGDSVEVTLELVDILGYADGAYELVFPLVVGPRYIPGAPVGHSGSGSAFDTDRVPDGSRISPPVLHPPEFLAERSGHDIEITVNIDAGLALRGLYSTSHALDVWELSATQRTVRLSPADTIPNKDFILRYEVAGAAPQIALLPYYDERGGFFTLLVQPQREVTVEQIVPRELIFIVDTSGSMSGFPIEKSKEAMGRLIRGMRPTDRFNVVRFAGDTDTLWRRPQAYSAQRAAEALRWVDLFTGSGGTEMAKGIVEALSQPATEGTLRLALLLTDGYVDEREIFDSIQAERRATRIFTLGVGSSPNRYLIDRAALLGRGAAFYVGHDEDSQEVIADFFARVDRPALVNIEIDWGGLDVDPDEIYPQRIPDLFAGRPLRIYGRYGQGGSAEIVVRGQLGGEPYEQRVTVTLPGAGDASSSGDAIASVWARQKIKSLMLDRVRLEDEAETETLIEMITTTGLDFRLMTRWTSFVAIDEWIANDGGVQRKVVQPVELPEGVDYDGIFGNIEGGMLGGSGSGIGGSFGLGGLGIRGTGSGGGGVAYGRGTVLLKSATHKRHRMTSLAPPMVIGSLAPEAIKRVIGQNSAQLRKLYEQALTRNPAITGKIIVTFVIGANGRVIKAKIKSSTLGDALMERQILALIKKWRFARPTGGGVVEVSYPFVFTPNK